MLTDSSIIRAYFAKLGLEAEIADIYLALLRHGPQNISALSRNAHIERTRIYRLIDKLLDSNLIEVETRASRRGVMRAAPIHSLRTLINQRIQEARNLEAELDLVEKALASKTLDAPGLQVSLYQGQSGLRTALGNILAAETEITGFITYDLDDLAGQDFMQRWREATRTTNARARILAPESLPEPTRPNLAPSWQTASCAFALGHTLLVHGPTLTHIQQYNRDVTCLVIRSEAQADTHQATFQHLWELAAAANPV